MTPHDSNKPAIPATRNLSIDTFSENLSNYLTDLGLPATGILVPVNERMKVIKNLPDISADLTPEQRDRAMYISKFVAACAAGLFDAALNFLWNETVTNLRHKVEKFDLEYFFDSAISDPKKRSRFKIADDLKELDDWELVKGCLTTGIITDLGYKHLDYIRTMRNHASAAHPNHNQLTGLQVVSWLETCQKEVLSREPEGAVVEVRRLLSNIRSQSFVPADIPQIESAVVRLPNDLVSSLARTLFGMFSDPSIPSSVRNNIYLVTPCVWKRSTDESKKANGLYYATLAANGDIPKKQNVYALLSAVDGLSFLPEDSKAVDLQILLQSLWQAHHGYNNFANEGAPAAHIQKYIPPNGDIPPSIEYQYIKTIAMCRMGNGYGVSWSAKNTYDDLIGRFSSRQVAILLMLFTKDVEFQTHLQFNLNAKNFMEIITLIKNSNSDPKITPLLNRILSLAPIDMSPLSGDSTFQTDVEDLYLKTK